MAYELKWGNRTWLYAFTLGLGIGMAVLLLFKDMLGDKAFWNYYSPMLGYYVLLSICQSHYFRKKPVPDMSGMFRQFVSIFGAIVIFFLNEAIMLYIFGMPEAGGLAPPTEYIHGKMVMGGHFTFIVFGFFIYGFDDFMFKGKLLGWMKNDTLKAVTWYFFIWFVWGILFYSDIGVAKAHSTSSFDGMALNRMLGISQWMIIISLLYALLFKDWLPDIQERFRIKNDYFYGVILLAAAAAIGAAIAYMLFYLAPLLSPSAYDGLANQDSDIWHHVLYMGTFPLIPAILIGAYTKNFSHLPTSGQRVVRRLMVFIPAVIILYFGYHWIIARPEILINYFAPGTIDKGFGLFGEPDNNWYHQLGLYFNFTVSIIPLTHHWFCGKAGFMKEVPDEPEEDGHRGRRYAAVRERPGPSHVVEDDEPKQRTRSPGRLSYGARTKKESYSNERR